MEFIKATIVVVLCIIAASSIHLSSLGVRAQSDASFVLQTNTSFVVTPKDQNCHVQDSILVANNEVLLLTYHCDKLGTGMIYAISVSDGEVLSRQDLPTYAYTDTGAGFFSADRGTPFTKDLVIYRCYGPSITYLYVIQWSTSQQILVVSSPFTYNWLEYIQPIMQLNTLDDQLYFRAVTTSYNFTTRMNTPFLTHFYLNDNGVLGVASVKIIAELGIYGIFGRAGSFDLSQQSVVVTTWRPATMLSFEFGSNENFEMNVIKAAWNVTNSGSPLFIQSNIGWTIDTETVVNPVNYTSYDFTTGEVETTWSESVTNSSGIRWVLYTPIVTLPAGDCLYQSFSVPNAPSGYSSMLQITQAQLPYGPTEPMVTVTTLGVNLGGNYSKPLSLVDPTGKVLIVSASDDSGEFSVYSLNCPQASKNHHKQRNHNRRASHL